MLTTSNIRNYYEKIQKQLFYMIPEKWDRVYLYASIVDRFNGLQTGEMFFYYFPKSIIKKNPVNVYEVPSKFNIDEKAYLKLAEKLYDEIKALRKELIKAGEKPWTNVTISIENFKFNAQYYYENLQNSKYTSYDRHLIWRHQYLNIPLSSYSKKERKMIEEYLSQNEHKNNENTYQEGIYKKPVSNIIEYNKQEDVGVEDIVNPQTVHQQNIETDALVNQSEQQTTIKSQILNTTNN
ncbi:MAG: antitoxin YezG family protein [Clostridia bacterium]|nr:antitoxin YezG family protein [Clostridia bacterium]